MSLRKLPDVQNFAEPEGYESIPSLEALDHWNPALRIKAQAAGGATVIEILDLIGKDPFTGEGVGPQDIAAQLKGAGEVVCNINSRGGSFYDGVTIYNLFKSHPGKVTMNVIGLAASAASIIAMAGDVINMGPAAFMMIHNGQGVCMGDRHDMANAVTNLTSIDAAIRDLYVARTGKHANSIATMMDNETLMNASDAIKNGFADATIEKAQLYEDGSASNLSNPIQAKKYADAVLAQHGVTRSRRRSIFAAIKAGPNDPIYAEQAAGIAQLRDLMGELRDGFKALTADVDAAAMWQCSADSGLALDGSEAWDGPGATQRVLDSCGFSGDTPNVAKAKQAFLFHDSSAPNLRGSYKEPFADMVGGEMKAVRGGVRAAASRLPQTMDVPTSVKDQARSVLTHYEMRFQAADAAGGTHNAADEATLQAGLRAIADDLRGLKTTAT